MRTSRCAVYICWTDDAGLIAGGDWFEGETLADAIDLAWQAHNHHAQSLLVGQSLEFAGGDDLPGEADNK